MSTKSTQQKRFLGTDEVAEELGAERWQVTRLFLEGDVPEPERVGGRRVIERKSLPTIRRALKRRGYI